MKRRKLRGYVIPTICLILICTIIFSSYKMYEILSYKPVEEDIQSEPVINNNYDNDEIVNATTTSNSIIRPYASDSVTATIPFYNREGTEEEQTAALIYYEGIYMQNSGVDYSSEESFDVLSSLSGTVTDVKEDTLLGKTVEIRNSSEVVTLYQCLSDVSVKKGDTIAQGQVIAQSGTCALNGDVKNGLHFEMYKNGTVINPEKYYDKSVKELTDN